MGKSNLSKQQQNMDWEHAGRVFPTFISKETRGSKQPDVTCVQFVLCVPESNAVAMEILLSRPVNFKLQVHLPVLQVTRLQTKKRKQKHIKHRKYWYTNVVFMNPLVHLKMHNIAVI